MVVTEHDLRVQLLGAKHPGEKLHELLSSGKVGREKMAQAVQGTLPAGDADTAGRVAGPRSEGEHQEQTTAKKIDFAFFKGLAQFSSANLPPQHGWDSTRFIKYALGGAHLKRLYPLYLPKDEPDEDRKTVFPKVRKLFLEEVVKVVADRIARKRLADSENPVIELQKILIAEDASLFDLDQPGGAGVEAEQAEQKATIERTNQLLKRDEETKKVIEGTVKRFEETEFADIRSTLMKGRDTSKDSRTSLVLDAVVHVLGKFSHYRREPNEIPGLFQLSLALLGLDAEKAEGPLQENQVETVVGAILRFSMCGVTDCLAAAGSSAANSWRGLGVFDVWQEYKRGDEVNAG